MGLTYAPDGRDRRMGLRVPQTRGVKVFHPAANRYIPAQTIDLSPTGLRVTLPASAAVAPGAVVQVHVESAGSNGVAAKRAMIPATIVWVDRSGSAVMAGLRYQAAGSNVASSAA